MARAKNDGRGRIGGRAAGTPNKTSGALKSILSDIVTDYLNAKDTAEVSFSRDILEMKPDERARIITGLASYVVPKQQAITAEASIQAEYKALERLLNDAPEEAVDAIAAKVLEMNTKAQA